MWLITSSFGYLLTAVLGTAIILCFAKKYINALNNFKTRKLLSSIQITEVKDREECKKACTYIKAHCQDLSALGFDCEWVSINGTQRPVALLQLATVHGFCCLFRLNILGEIPPELEELLNDSEILKLGVSPLNDSNLLKKDYNIQVWSTLDLRYLYPSGGGLASLAASVINVHLDKSWQLQCSNWENPILTNSQKDYAAKDAFVAIEIFKTWLLNENNLKTVRTNYCDLFSEKVKLKISQFLDIHYKPNHLEKSATTIKNISLEENSNYQNQKKEKSNFLTRKLPLYDNCFMHAPDGELLCSCDKRKAEWYLERGLAEVLSEEPYTIKLLFEPAVRPGKTNGGRFYQQLKQNRCVVCGALDSYLKHNVVPREYRKHFPVIMKDHQSHDIVLICLDCHMLASRHKKILRNELALLCDAPLTVPRVSQDRTIVKMENWAKALLNAGDVIPVERKTYLENEIKKYYKVENLTKESLQNILKSNSKIINENYESHGIKVVNYFLKEGGGLQNLEILWRKHFLETMKPEYLPALWSVTHNHSRLATISNEKENLDFFSTNNLEINI